MRADRLLKMMLLLQKNQRMTAQNLATDLEVSLSTIYRDIDALSVAGIPVYTQSGPQGGIFIDEEFRASLANLSQGQTLALFLAANTKTLADIGMAETTEVALLKMFSTLPTTHKQEVRRMQQRIYIDSQGWFQARESRNVLEGIQQAILEDQRIELDYQSSDGGAYRVTLDAYALVSKADRWYLVGRKESRAFRIYRLSRIKQLTLLNEIFARDLEFDLPQYWHASQARYAQMGAEGPAYPVELSLHADGFGYVVGYLEGRFQEVGTADEKPWAEVMIWFYTQDEAISHLLALGTRVRVKAPVHLKGKMKQAAEELQQHYAGA